MEPESQPPSPPAPRARPRARAELGAAAAASSEGALTARVAELETVLAVERAENARRLREAEGHTRVMRASLQQLQGDFRRLASERDALREALFERDATIDGLERRIVALRAAADDAAADREGVAAAVVASAVTRAQQAESDLVHARDLVTALEERIRELEGEGRDGGRSTVERIERLEQETARRDEALMHAAQTIRDYEDRLNESETRGQLMERANDRLRRRIERLITYVETLPVATHDPLFDELREEPRDGRRAADRAAHDSDSDDSGTYVPVVEPGAPALPAQPAARDAATTARGDAAAQADNAFEGLRIEREVERSPACVLYEARELATRRPVHVYVLPGGGAPGSARVEALLRARHPGLAAALAFGCGPGGPFLVAERAAGERLDDRVGRSGPLSDEQALDLATQMASALRVAAFHGVVHGDLGPSAVHVDDAFRVRIVGVGVGGLLPSSTDVRDAAFAAPERLRGAPADVRGDVYALGALLSFCLTGTVPFTGSRDEIARRKSVQGVPDPLAAGAVGCERAAALVRALGRADPVDRPAGWDDVLALLGREREAPRGAASAAHPARRPWLFAALLGAPLVVVAALLATGATRRHATADLLADAARRADACLAQGDVEGARGVWRELLADTASAEVAREAARRLGALDD